MKSQYDQMFKHTKLEDNVQSFLDQHRCRFHQSIVSQQMLTELACLEPTFVWLNSSLSKSLYSRLAEHQTNLFRALHDLDLAVMIRAQFDGRFTTLTRFSCCRCIRGQQTSLCSRAQRLLTSVTKSPSCVLKSKRVCNYGSPISNRAKRIVIDCLILFVRVDQNLAKANCVNTSDVSRDSMKQSIVLNKRIERISINR